MTGHGSIASLPVDELQRRGARTVFGQSMADLTTFRLGGPCRLLVDCPAPEVLIDCWSWLTCHGIAPLMIGGGSNLLVSDGGIDQVVVRFSTPEAGIRMEGSTVHVSAGAQLDELASATAESGLDGLVTCSGIPGTVGGAIAGNAGAFGQQMGDALISVDAIASDGSLVTLPAAELGFTYRHSCVGERGLVLVRARFALVSSDAVGLMARRAEILALRASKHPDWRTTPTAGSFFKNIEPTSKAERRQAAGWYLEQAGAHGMKVGGAHTFARHANIVVADPGATASDVKELTDRMAAAVKTKFGLALQREVKIIGSFP